MASPEAAALPRGDDDTKLEAMTSQLLAGSPPAPGPLVPHLPGVRTCAPSPAPSGESGSAAWRSPAHDVPQRARGPARPASPRRTDR